MYVYVVTAEVGGNVEGVFTTARRAAACVERCSRDGITVNISKCYLNTTTEDEDNGTQE